MTESADLRFSYEWNRSDGVVNPEMAATWARFEVWSGADCLTQVEDADSGSSRRGIYCALYPLAEWTAYNWWLLRAHIRPASLLASAPGAWHAAPMRGWLKHHNLRAAGDGFIWPNLTILPEGGATRLVWRADRRTPSYVPIRYLLDGESVVDSMAVEHSLAGLVESVLARLEERGVHDSALEKEWRAVTAADDDEREFCVAAARLGLDPYVVDADMEATLTTVADRLDGQLLADFLDSVDPHAISSGLAWVERSSQLLDQLGVPTSERLTTLRQELPTMTATSSNVPWSVGWQQAAFARKVLEAEPNEPFDFADMVTLKTRRLEDQTLQAVGGLTDGGGAGLVLRRKDKKRDARFKEARALWHLANDAEPTRFLLTTGHTGRQRIERAFAAELLAPAEGVRSVLGALNGGPVGLEDIGAVAEHFQVSPFVVRHQVENQLQLAVAD